jgi:broad specificity phosphatase PhoE
MVPRCRFLLLRHGESTWNAEGRWQGWADPGLSEQGERQSEDGAVHLRGLGLSAIASSDLRRALETADILSTLLDLGPVVVERGLRERDVGEWQGLTPDEIEAGWPGGLAAYRSGRQTSPPGGEDSPTLAARATSALESVAHRLPDAMTLVVTHGGVIRSLERSLGVEPPDAGVPNLGGRWFQWSEGVLAPGEAVVAVDPDALTSPPSR